MATAGDVLTALRKTRYLGSHPKVTSQAEKIDIEFTRTGVRFGSKRQSLGTIPWATTRSLAADSRESLEQRFPAASMVLLGVVALLAKQTVSYLVIEDDDGTWVFAVPGLSAIELKSGLTHLQKFVPKPQDVHDGPPDAQALRSGSAASDRLRGLKSLLDEGLITDDEYAQRRIAILGDL